MAEPLGCSACGWTLNQEQRCHYTSHLKLFYGASTRGVWSIGSHVILKDRPDEGPKTKVEANTLNYLANTNIPAPKVLRDWVDRDGRYFILNERIPGQTLEEMWPSLPEFQKIDIADQVVQVRKQLRSITSPSIQCVDQSPCYPGLLFFDLEPHGPFHSDQELWDALALNLDLPQHIWENLKKRLPKCEPYVLTHCDLNLGNIMIREGKIWMSNGKKLLQDRLGVHGEAHEDAKAFWKEMCDLRQNSSTRV